MIGMSAILHAAAVLGSDPYNDADIVLDFAGVRNGGAPFYRRDGVVYASASAAGFTGTGTFNAAGYTAAGAERIAGSITPPSGVTIFGKTAPTPASSNRRMLSVSGGAFSFDVRRTTGNIFTTSPSTTEVASFSTVAMAMSSGVFKASFDGVPPAPAGFFSAPGSSMLTIGNAVIGTLPWAAAISLVMVFYGDLTDAEIQALGT